LPIYRYRCQSCSCEFDLRRSFGEDSGAPCPKCKGEGRRLFLPVPIIFKGPGFYITDNRAKNSAGEGANEEKKEVAKEASKEPANKKDGNGSE